MAPPLYAGIGAIATAIATIAAVTAMPVRNVDGESMVLPGILMTIGLGFAPVLASMKNAKAVLRLEYLLPLSLFYWLLLDLLQGDQNFDLVSVDGIRGALISIGVFGAACYLSAYLGRWRLPRIVLESAVTPISARTLFAICALCFFLGSFKFFYAVGFDPFTLLYYAGVNRWSAPWAAERLGGWSSILDHLPYFGYVCPVMAVTLALRVGWLRVSTFIALLMACLLLLLLAQGGGRRVVGVMAGAPLIAWILAQRGITPRRIAVILLVVSSIFYFMEVMLEYRNRGIAAYFGSGLAITQLERLNVDDNFYRLAQTVDIVPEKHEYVYFQQVFYTIVRPIPRAIWPGKPQSAGFDLTEHVPERGLTLSATVVAEWYVSGGLIAVFLGGLLYGQIARAASLLWALTNRDVGRLIYGVMAMALFAGVRSMIDLILMSYMVLAWLVVWWLFVGRRLTQQKRASMVATR